MLPKRALSSLVRPSNQHRCLSHEVKYQRRLVRRPALSVMDPVSVTASVIAIATAALQSAKALYNMIDGLVDAPQSVSQSKSLLSQTQTTLGTLMSTLEANSTSQRVNSVLKEIELSKALESTDSFCQAFAVGMKTFTSHSTDSHFSKRDRLAIYFNESKISRLNRDLAGCQRTITMVLSSITLYGPTV